MEVVWVGRKGKEEMKEGGWEESVMVSFPHMNKNGRRNKSISKASVSFTETNDRASLVALYEVGAE